MQAALAEAVSGVYCGWASVGSSPEVYMTAMSIGWWGLACCHPAMSDTYLRHCKVTCWLHAPVPCRNPYYHNEQRTAEPWLLHEFERDFYGGCQTPTRFMYGCSASSACAEECCVNVGRGGAEVADSRLYPAGSEFHIPGRPDLEDTRGC